MRLLHDVDEVIADNAGTTEQLGEVFLLLSCGVYPECLSSLHINYDSIGAGAERSCGPPVTMQEQLVVLGSILFDVISNNRTPPRSWSIHSRPEGRDTIDQRGRYVEFETWKYLLSWILQKDAVRLKLYIR